MGYMTEYTLTAFSTEKNQLGGYKSLVDNADVLSTIDAEIDRVCRMEQILPDTWEIYDKWYDWDSDISELSRKFPNVIFQMHGTGDSAEDLWDAYFLNGKIQRCPAIITYDEFDPSKLEEVN